MKLSKVNLVLCIIIASLSMLSVGALYGNKVLYKRLMKVQLDPTGRWFDTFNDNIGSPDCLFIGDSRVSQWKKYPPFCDSFMYGFSGFTSTQILLAMPMLEIPDSVEIVFLQLGINDLKAIGLYENKASTIRSNLIKNLEAITHFFLNKSINVYITTVIPSGKINYPRKLIWSALIDSSVNDINAYLLTLNMKGLQVIDTSKEFNQQFELYKDELHLNKMGYGKLNMLIMSPFNSLEITEDKNAF